MNTHREGWYDCINEVKYIMIHELRVAPCVEMTEMFAALKRRQLESEIKARPVGYNVFTRES